MTTLKINKSTAHIPIRLDEGIDVTAIRIGKQRLARKKDSKLSDLKQAILSSRERNSAPEVPSVEQQEGHEVAPDTEEKSLEPQSTGQAAESVIDGLAFGALKELSRLQSKGKDQPAEKRYKYKKFVVGFREVQRALQRGELKGIIVAVNLEDVDELIKLVNELEIKCAELEVPLVRALTRRRMGKALGKSMRQSLVGIVNLDGVHQPWKQIVQLWEDSEAN